MNTPYASKQFPRRGRAVGPSTCGTLYYVTPDGEKPVPNAIGLPYPQLQQIKSNLALRGIHNVIIHRHD